MDLRACTRSHFIATIIGGQVIKIPTNGQSKKGTKFKSIEEIYSYDSNCHDTEYPPRVRRSLAMPCGLEKANNKVKSEYIEEDNDLDLEGLTLRQLKGICKSHKRKALQSVNFTTIKQENNDLQSEMDEVDLKETLGSWKKKARKKTKLRKKSNSKHSSKSCTTSTLCGNDNKSVDLALIDISSEIYTPLKIKVEDDMYFSEPQTGIFVHEPQILTNEVYEQSDFLDQLSHEHLQQPLSITNSSCCLNQVSYENLDNVDQDLGIEETIKEDNSIVLSENPLVSGSDVKRELDVTDLMTRMEPITALLEANDSSFEIDHPYYRSPIQPSPYGNESSSEDALSMVLYSDCQGVEFTNRSEVSIDENGDIEEVGRRNATNFNSTEKLDTYIHSVLDVTTEGVPASPLGPKGEFQDIKCFEIGEDSKSKVEIGRDAENCDVEVRDENSLPLVKNVESQHNVTSGIEDEQLLVIDTQPCIAIDEPIKSASKEGIQENKLEQQPPERLFSARKTISPNSKEKLNRAMMSAEMQDDTQIIFSENLKATACTEKLFLETNAVDTPPSVSSVKKTRIILTSKRLEALRTTQTGSICKQTLSKSKTEKKLCDIKPTFNGGRVSCSSVQTSRACSTSASCYQNAIAFSQRQMVDIERLATKLVKELQTMKEMVVDSLQPDSRMCSTSRFNTDKARIAVENVKRVEEATNRWLAMLNRDCNRFCKIMELSEKKNASQKSNDEEIPDSELCQNNLNLETKLNEEQVSPSVQKERKIMFADEAGESLCHIKVL